jgi:flavin-dependent dehydrogenase
VRRRFDVAVVGAGPAGSALARRLAWLGVRVVLIERSRFDQPRVGESMAPVLQARLRELGLWDHFVALTPLPSWGTRSAWGEAEAAAHSHLTSPWGCGWHVERSAFDRMLAEGAQQAGAVLMTGTAVQRCTWGDRAWRLQITPGPDEFETRVLVDATGRRMQIGRALGATRVVYDRLVGVALAFSPVRGDARGHLLVETAEPGWWYSAPLPDATDEPGRDTMMLMLMTDADLCAQQGLARRDGWQQALRATRLTHARVNGAAPCGKPQVHLAHSQRLAHRDAEPQQGPWLAVGDAALAVDPVSGSGVPRSLANACLAAVSAFEMLDKPRRARDVRDAYDLAVERDCNLYLHERAAYYDIERRWQSPFWQRRWVADEMSTDPTGTDALAALR